MSDAPAFRYPFVIVEWLDATGPMDLVAYEETLPCPVAITAGFVVEENAKQITLAPEYFGVTDWKACTAIPKGCIQRMFEPTAYRVTEPYWDRS